jgi:hypothetical protein
VCVQLIGPPLVGAYLALHHRVTLEGQSFLSGFCNIVLEMVSFLAFMPFITEKLGFTCDDMIIHNQL